MSIPDATRFHARPSRKACAAPSAPFNPFAEASPMTPTEIGLALLCCTLVREAEKYSYFTSTLASQKLREISNKNND